VPQLRLLLAPGELTALRPGTGGLHADAALPDAQARKPELYLQPLYLLPRPRGGAYPLAAGLGLCIVPWATAHFYAPCCYTCAPMLPGARNPPIPSFFCPQNLHMRAPPRSRRAVRCEQPGLGA
jgi:hypothetical protein